jgi:flagellar basal-body rod modification protein FlgD
MSISIDSIPTLASATSSDLYENTSTMDKTDFLQLLMAQLEYQDPLDPQDSTEFVAQLCDFSNLEQLMNMNDSIESLQLLQLSANNTAATALIGKQVMFEGDTLTVENGTPSDTGFYAGSAGTSGTVTITDSNGKVVQTIALTDIESGYNTIDLSGVTLSDGTYTIGVAATDSAGASVDITVLECGKVTEIFFDSDGTYVEINGERYSLGDIYSISA